MGNHFLAFVLILFVVVGSTLWYMVEPENDETGCAYGGRRNSRDRDLYVRGQIHFLSMDYGMSSCWNHTVKRFLHLACPSLSQDTGTMEIELIVLLTSCFCESQGIKPPLCIPREAWEGDRAYTESMVNCVKEACFNHNGMDGYETIASRMPDLCHYYLEELQDSNPDMTRMNDMEDNDLEEMKNYVSGKTGERTALKTLEKLVFYKIKEEKKRLKRRLFDFLQEIWYILDDVKFRLGIGKYADPASYL